MYTTEMVFRGHPDKVCDQISDAILDECLKQDKNSRVACEVMGGKGKIFITGELTTKANVNYNQVVKRVLKDIGYPTNYELIINISKQSPDIALGVDIGGAGDQGIMFGYATNETEESLPLAYVLVQKLSRKYDEIQKEVNFLKPDGKCQITIEGNKINTLILSHQHTNELQEGFIKENVIDPICSKFIDENTKILINPTGRFLIGGFEGDSGLTGRKIIVDTYGSFAKHGGGAFSGKDPSKVDRSGAYILRKIAKNIIKNKLADKIEIQISYAIGVRDPISININTFDTEKVSLNEIMDFINTYDLTPNGIIKYLDLLNPIYEETAKYGHFGNDNFMWE